MRLSLKLNGILRLIASVPGPGYLGTHLNLADRPKEHERSGTLHITGLQTRDTETVRLEWPKLNLQTGDTVELALMSDGEGDPPSDVRKSSESPKNLFSDPDLASQLIAIVSRFDSELMEMLQKSEGIESAEEHKKFALAAGHVLTEIGDRLLYPIYRRHKELIPEDLKGEIL